MPDTGVPADLDRFLNGLDYPMFIVTTQHGGQRAGCLVGFATQASIDPPRMLVCLSVQNRTCEVASDADVLAVHVLDVESTQLATLFGGTTGDEIDKFARCRWEPGPRDVPLLLDASGWLVGSILKRIPLGDHIGFLLDPIVSRRERVEPALTFQQVQDLSPGHPA